MIGITVLGSTGSIGVSTLDVVGRHPERFRVVALTANRDAEGLAAQCRRHQPTHAVMADAGAAARLRELLEDMPSPPEVHAGPEALETVAALPEVDYVMAAIVGAAGLLPTLAAARAGKRLLLANKEALVMVSGAIFMERCATAARPCCPSTASTMPIFQCLPADYRRGLAQVGVRADPADRLRRAVPRPAARRTAAVTPDQACAHPNWRWAARSRSIPPP